MSPVFIDWDGRLSCSPRVYGFLYASKFPLVSFLQQKDHQSIFLQLGYLRILDCRPFCTAVEGHVTRPDLSGFFFKYHYLQRSSNWWQVKSRLFLALQGFCFVTRSRLSMASIFVFFSSSNLHYSPSHTPIDPERSPCCATSMNASISCASGESSFILLVCNFLHHKVLLHAKTYSRDSRTALHLVPLIYTMAQHGLRAIISEKNRKLNFFQVIRTALPALAQKLSPLLFFLLEPSPWLPILSSFSW